MTSTPNKSELNTSFLTPVRFLDSPKLKTDSPHIFSRLQQILGTLQKNQEKWESAQNRGLSLCRSIEAVKTKALESKQEKTSAYPPELKSYCDKLMIMMTIFEDVLLSAKESLKQITALTKMNKNSQETFYRTWTLAHFLDFVTKAVDCYQKEYDIKKIVTVQIAHSRERSELVLHTSVWEYPEYIDDEFKLMFIFLSLEINGK